MFTMQPLRAHKDISEPQTPPVYRQHQTIPFYCLEKQAIQYIQKRHKIQSDRFAGTCFCGRIYDWGWDYRKWKRTIPEWENDPDARGFIATPERNHLLSFCRRIILWRDLPDHGYELPIYPESDTKVFKKATYHFLTGRNAICPAPSYQHVTYNCL